MKKPHPTELVTSADTSEVRRLHEDLENARKLIFGPEADRWATAVDVEEAIGFDRKTIYGWARDVPGFPCTRISRSVRFNVDEVKAWLSANGDKIREAARLRALRVPKSAR